MALYEYGHREFPGASYDRWKTTPPDDWYGHGDEEQEECRHERWSLLDHLTGLAGCDSCDEEWHLTTAEVRGWEQREDAWQREWRRSRTWWFKLWKRVRDRLADWKQRRRRRLDDEIPF